MDPFDEIEAQIFGHFGQQFGMQNQGRHIHGMQRPGISHMRDPFDQGHPRDMFDEIESTFFGGS